MRKHHESLNYLLIITVYRFINGVLAMAISWRLLEIQPDGWSLSIAIGVSFAPAVLVPKIVKTLVEKSSASMLSSFAILSLTFITLVSLAMLSHPFLLFGAIFLLWIVYFILEASLDGWLGDVCHNLTEVNSKKLIAYAMTCTQVATMLGSIITSPVLKGFGYLGLFILCAAVYGGIGLLCVVTNYRNARYGHKNVKQVQKKNTSIEELSDNFIQTYPTLFFAAALIWPSLGLINLLIPYYTKNILDSSVQVAGNIDAALGAGMALVGIFMSSVFFVRYKRAGFLASIIFILVTPLAFLPMFAHVHSSIFLIGGGFLGGVGFGGYRILLRTKLAQDFSPKQFALFTSRANAFGFPVLLVFLGVNQWVQDFSAALVCTCSFVLFTLFAFHGIFVRKESKKRLFETKV